MDVEKVAKEKNIKIIVKPNSPATKITAVDDVRNALRVDVKASPDKGKANREVIKFFSKLLKKKVKIVYGLKSREKILRMGD